MKKSEGGHAKGHSNMAHWDPTAVVKAESKKIRRQNDRLSIEEQGWFDLMRDEALASFGDDDSI